MESKDSENKTIPFYEDSFVIGYLTRKYIVEPYKLGFIPGLIERLDELDKLPHGLQLAEGVIYDLETKGFILSDECNKELQKELENIPNRPEKDKAIKFLDNTRKKLGEQNVVD